MGLGTGHGCSSSRTRRCKARRHLLRPQSLWRGQQDKGHVPACGTSSAMARPGKEQSQPSAPPRNTGGVGRGQDTQPARGGGQVGQDPAAGHAATVQERNRRKKGPGTVPRCRSCPSQPRAGGCSHNVPARGARRDPKSGVWAASTPSPPQLPFPAGRLGVAACPTGPKPPSTNKPRQPWGWCCWRPQGLQECHPTDLRAPAQPAVDGMCLPHGYCSTRI